MTLSVAAAPAPQAGVCDSLPGPASAACDAAAGLGGGVGGVVESVASTAVSGLAAAFAEAAGSFLGALGGALEATTQVDIASPWFLERYAAMFGLSALLTFGLLVLAVLKAVVRGQGAEAVRSSTVYYLAAVVASSFAPAVVYLLLRLSDQLTAVFAMGTEDEVEAFLTDTGELLATTALAGAPGVGSVAVLLASVFTVLCAAVLWMELLLRTAIIYVSLLFAAPTFSGLVDRGLWKHSRRWLYFTISVIFAKPVVVAVLGLAASGAAAGGTDDAFSSVFVALALLLVAIFTVGLLFRLVPNAGDEIAGALTARRELKTATPNSPLPNPGVVVRQGVQSHLVRGIAKGGAAGATAGAAVPVAVAQYAGAAVHRTAARATEAVPTTAGGT